MPGFNWLSGSRKKYPNSHTRAARFVTWESNRSLRSEGGPRRVDN